MSGVDLSPFRIAGPTVVANSGGKTSGYNLWLHLQANGGTLTDAGRCVFTNTGWEHPATLDFLAEQERRWGVKIDAVEFTRRPARAAELEARRAKYEAAVARVERFRAEPASYFARRGRVDRLALFDSRADPEAAKAEAVRKAEAYASRCWDSWAKARIIGIDSYRRVALADADTGGRPFQELLEGLERFRREAKGLPGVLPNAVQRICTGELKVKVTGRYAAAVFGVPGADFECRLGLRADEEQRVAAAEKWGRGGGRSAFPLHAAGVEKADVAAFWAKQPFGLSLKAFEGNCGGCYMKRREALVNLIRRDFFDAGWWEGWEARTGQRFRAERSYRGLRAVARTELSLLPIDDLDNAITCESGYCSN